MKTVLVIGWVVLVSLMVGCGDFAAPLSPSGSTDRVTASPAPIHPAGSTVSILD